MGSERVGSLKPTREACAYCGLEIVVEQYPVRAFMWHVVLGKPGERGVECPGSGKNPFLAALAASGWPP